MKKRKIYIFNDTSRAAAYGIGTFIDQLINCLKDTDLEFEVVHLNTEGNEISVIKKDGYKQIYIPSVGYPDTTNSYCYYYRNIAYLLKEFIPRDNDMQYIFHLNFMTNVYLITYLKKLFKCKIILTAHYTNWSFSLLGDYTKLRKILKKKKSKLTDEFEKGIVRGISEDTRMIKKCDYFVCIAQHTLKSFKETCNIDLTKTLLINNGLTDTFHQISGDKKKIIRKKYYISEDVKIIFFAGRLDEVKGISFLINAYKKVIKTHPNTHLFIAGEGNFDQWIKEAKDCCSKISFTGRLEKKQLYEFYNIANIGIVCSIHEEFGFVAIEMMMHQLPIVVTDTGGLSEIIEDNITGLKVPVMTIKGKRIVNSTILSEKIKYLLDNPQYAQKMGLNARKKFLEKYEISVFKEKMLNLYQNI